MFSLVSILWCTHAASSIFVAVLRMSDQRFLVAYPVGLLYGCFALFRSVSASGDFLPGPPLFLTAAHDRPVAHSVFTVGVPSAK